MDRITSIKVRRPSDTSKGMTIYLEIILFFGAPIYEVVKSLQTKIKLKVEGMTSMPVKNIDVSIRSLTVRPPDIPKNLQKKLRRSRNGRGGWQRAGRGMIDWNRRAAVRCRRMFFCNDRLPSCNLPFVFLFPSVLCYNRTRCFKREPGKFPRIHKI